MIQGATVGALYNMIKTTVVIVSQPMFQPSIIYGFKLELQLQQGLVVLRPAQQVFGPIDLQPHINVLPAILYAKLAQEI